MPQPRKSGLGLLAHLSTGGEAWLSASQGPKRGPLQPSCWEVARLPETPTGLADIPCLVILQPQPRRQLRRGVLGLLLRLALGLWAPAPASPSPEPPVSKPMASAPTEQMPSQEKLLPVRLPPLLYGHAPHNAHCSAFSNWWAWHDSCAFHKWASCAKSASHHPCSLLMFRCLWGQCHLIPILTMPLAAPSLVILLCLPSGYPCLPPPSNGAPSVTSTPGAYAVPPHLQCALGASSCPVPPYNSNCALRALGMGPGLQHPPFWPAVPPPPLPLTSVGRVVPHPRWSLVASAGSP